MSTTPGPSSSNSNGTLPARLLFDPSLATCPDYAATTFDDLRAAINANDSDAAITQLTASWTKNNDKDKAQWIIQVEADRAQAEAEEIRHQQEAADKVAEAAKVAEEARLEAEKKEPRLGEFDAHSAPSTFLQSRISTFAEKKLKNREYCPLWPFTAAGLKEGAAALLSSAEDGSSFSLGRSDGNQLVLQSGPSSNIHKNMVRNENLSEKEFSRGSLRYLKEITAARWPAAHVEALTQFFYALSNHHLMEKENGSQILRIYADRYRYSWFLNLGTSKSFNIAIINEDVVKEIRDEYIFMLHQRSLAGLIF
ncbi:hypothetical protein B0H14DRAFT_3468620 [Mycena olivaceomarginata]|nr:hypothetical protein B0H14DRAFT_3468620 [Mycena olivaceomarginata]